MRKNDIGFGNLVQVVGGGLGLTGNLVGATSQVLRATRQLENTSNLSRLSKADDFVQPVVVKWPGEVPQRWDELLPVLNKECFVAGTLISTRDGLQPIETIQAGDEVWSFDLDTQKWRLCLAHETFTVEHDGDLYEVSIAGDTITSSYHHPYWVIEGESLAERPTPEHVQAAIDEGGEYPGRWVDAGDLQVGDLLLLRDGRQERVTEITVRQSAETLYNFAVDDLHNYAVGNFGVLVHNNCALWSSTKNKTGVENAFGHFKKHGAEFPEFPNATQYVQGAKKFVTSPPQGTLTKVRPNGDKLFYDPATNTFAVQRRDGALRTMFRPTDGLNYWNKQ